jgi:thioredoxin
MARIFTVILAAMLFITATFAVRAKESVIAHTTSQSFVQDVISSQKPVLVQFDASWCPFCRKFQPVLQRFHEKYKDSIDVYKIDADAEGDLMIRLGVRTLPTVVLFYKGKEVERRVGFADDEKFSNWVAEQIGKLAQEPAKP